MTRIKIFYFSGTGNTELVCRDFEAEFRRLGCEAGLIRIEDLDAEAIGIDAVDCDLLGIACPVIGFGAPLLVRRFIRALPRAEGRRVFIARTAGGVAPVNYNASRGMIRGLKSRGYDVFYERLFSIGSNWIVRFANGTMRKLRDATEAKVAQACGQLLAGRRRELRTPPIQGLVMGLARFASSIVLRLVAKDLRVGASCVRCGLCVRGCPSRNIREGGGKIRFGASCNGCMRCVYSCPRGAIRFKALGFFPVKGGYDIRKILARPQDCPDEGSLSEPPFLARYLSELEF
jgi:ferredoxin